MIQSRILILNQQKLILFTKCPFLNQYHILYVFSLAVVYIVIYVTNKMFYSIFIRRVAAHSERFFIAILWNIFGVLFALSETFYSYLCYDNTNNSVVRFIAKSELILELIIHFIR